MLTKCGIWEVVLRGRVAIQYPGHRQYLTADRQAGTRRQRLCGLPVLQQAPQGKAEPKSDEERVAVQPMWRERTHV